jgi:hypothetical protein
MDELRAAILLYGSTAFWIAQRGQRLEDLTMILLESNAAHACF